MEALAEPSPIPVHQHTATHPTRSPSLGGSGVGGADAYNSSSSSHSGRSHGAGTRRSHPPVRKSDPQQLQSSVSTTARINEETAFGTHLSLSTCGGSTSNLTNLSYGQTQTDNSATASSESSTPISGATARVHSALPSHHPPQQVCLTVVASPACVEGVCNEEDEEEESVREGSRSRLPSIASDIAPSHFTSRSTPSSKRPRQAPPATSPAAARNTTEMTANPITGEDPSSMRAPNPQETEATMEKQHSLRSQRQQPHRVRDIVEYDRVEKNVDVSDNAKEEKQDGVTREERQNEEETRDAQTNAAAVAVVATSKHAVGFDSTPMEPPPKRFASDDDVDLREMMHLESLQSTTEETEADGHRVAPIPLTPVNEEEDRGGDGGEYSRENVPESGRRTRQPSLTRVQDLSGYNSNMHIATNNGSSRSPLSRKEVSRESRRKQRARTGASTSTAAAVATDNGSLLGGLWHSHNDSITASIPYDPSRFHSPSNTRHQAERESPRMPSGNNSSTTAVPTMAPACNVRQATQQDEAQHAHHEAKATATSCATPPIAPPPPAIALVETRYAFLAISFMMRMLCKLHTGEPIPSSDFHSHCIPPMSVTMYVQRLVRYCSCSGEALLCAFILLLKYVFHSGHPVTIYNAHRLLITSIVLGIKLRDDVYYSNVYYGRIGGISGREMNKLELLFLSKLDWATQVHEEEYAALLDLLQELAVDVDPSMEQLKAFAETHPELVAAYTPDDEDAELEEAAMRLQQGGSSSTTTTTVTTGSAMNTAAPSVGLRTKVSSVHRPNEDPEGAALVDFSDRQRLRGAFRRYQWLTRVEPWMQQLQEQVFTRHTADTAATETLWTAEGDRWQTYYRDDEAEALRQQREQSPNAWLSPLTVQSGGSNIHNGAGAALIGQPNASVSFTTSWASEPLYASGNAQQQQQQNESSARYSNFINFANVMTGGYFGNTAPSSSATANNASGSTRNSNYSGSNTTYHGAATSVLTGSTGGSQPRYHTAASAGASFGITNRTASTSSPAEGVGARFSAQQQQRHPTVVLGPNESTSHSHSGATQAASPTSSTTPGSGINVNAQPYYYVRSRAKQQQQQHSTDGANNTDPSPASIANESTRSVFTTIAAPLNASLLEVSSASDSSFTSPSCANGAAARFSNYGSASSPFRVDGIHRDSQANNNIINSSSTSTSAGIGMEAVVSAMKRAGTSAVATTDTTHVKTMPQQQHVDVQDEGSRSHRHSSGNLQRSTAATSFPAHPISRGAGNGMEGEQSVSGQHPPRRSPPMPRRAQYAAQHALGKKRSKPDSYKDY